MINNLCRREKEALAALGLCLLFYVLLPFVIVRFLPGTVDFVRGMKWIIAVPMVMISLFMFAYAGKFYLKADDFKNIPYIRISLYNLGMLIVCGLASIAWLKLLEILKIQYDKNVPAEEFIRSCEGYEIILAAVFVCILTPFFEEIIFRRIIFDGVRIKCPHVTSIAITSMLFAMLHGIIFQLFPLFLLGVYFQVLYCSENKLGASIYAHFFNNSLAFAALLLLKFFNLSAGIIF